MIIANFRPNITIALLMVSSVLFTHLAYAKEKPHNITYYTEVYAPSSYYHNEQLIGLSVDLIKLIWRDLNIPEQPILVVPWARGYKEVSEKPNTALFAMSKTKQRASKFKWVGPLFTAEYFIIAQPKSTLPVTDIKQLFSNSIAVIRNDVTEYLVREQKFPNHNIVSAKNISDALNLFNAHRVDMLAISRSGLNSAINQRLIRANGYQRVYLLKSIEDYIAFSKDTPDETITAFQASLDKLHETHQSLKVEYNLL